jgi:hypothetical protein
MARIRTVKPEFWTDERVGECSVSARLLFIACWNFSDDYGGLDRSAKQLKAQAFPYDAIDCEPLVQELLNVGLLIEYAVEGKMYLHISGFRKHQKVEKPAKPRIPVYEDSMKTPRVLPESSPTSSGSSLGREGKGKGSKNTDRAAAQPEPGEFVELRRDFPKRAGSHRWQDALGAYRARIHEGATPQAILSGVRRYAAFIRATGKEGTEYVQQAATFLGKNRGFELPWHPPAKPETAGERLMRNLNGNDDSRVIEHDPAIPALTGH